MKIGKLEDITLECVGEKFELIVLLSRIDIRLSQNNNRFVNLIIQDRSRVMDAKYWDYDENKDFIDSLKEGEVIKIKASISEYMNKAQVIVSEMEKLDIKNVNIKDLIITSNWDYDKMINGLNFFYKKVNSSHLKELLDKMIFSNNNYFKKFSTHLAAKKIHHNYYHGLLQHTLEVLKYAYMVATTNKLSKRQTERLIVMSFLHDWGKIIEYKSFPDNDRTDEGKMMGHIFLGAYATLNYINEIENFDKDDELIILNGILGHHGKLEYGSPVLPRTIEAQILHQADVMSSYSESISSFLNEYKDENKNNNFTPKLWNMNTCYYKKGI